MTRDTPALSALPGLADLTPAQAARVREVGREVDVPARWSLILEDQPADTAYLLLRGRVAIRSHGQEVTELGPGSFIGETGLVARRLRSATVTTLEPVSTLAFPRVDFAALRNEIPAFDALVTGLAEQRAAENQSRRRIDTVVLDVDGTLVDTVYQHVRAWAEAFDEVGVEVSGWRLHRAIGMGGDRLVTEVAGQSVENALGDRIRARHDVLFAETLPGVRALPGARDLLAELRHRGLKVVIASSGEPDQTARLLRLVDGDDLAHGRATSADAERSKPAPDLVDVAVESVGGVRAVVIGDAIWDVEAANAQGRPSIGLLSGGFGEQELRTAGAGHVYDDLQHLLDCLDEIPLAR